MNERFPNPFILRHPMSLGDAVAALFRGQPRRKPPALDPPALRPPFKTAPVDDLFAPAERDSKDSDPVAPAQANGSH